MTKDEALKLALVALEKVTTEMLALKDELAERGARPTTNVFHQRLWDSSFKAYTDHALPAATAIEKALAQQTDEFKCPLCYDDIANIKNPSQPEQEPVGGSMTTPEPPPECQTEAEKKAFAFGWWKAMEAQREDKSQEFPKRFDTHPSPPQRPWVGLTDWEVASIYMNHTDRPMYEQWNFARAIEAKLKQKNGYAEEKNT